MSLKIKLISSILAFFLILSFLIVGVFAVKKTEFDVGGNITFNAQGVEATVRAGKEGAANKESPTNEETFEGFDTATIGTVGSGLMDTLEIDPTKTDADLAEDYGTWDNIQLIYTATEYTEGGVIGKIHFNVTNNSTTKPLYVYITPTKTPDYMEITSTGDEEIPQKSGEGPATTKYYTIEFKVTEDVAFQSKPFSVKVELTIDKFQPYYKNGDNYYINMGKTSSGDPIKWQLVGYYDENAETLEKRHINYKTTDNLEEMKGKIGVFVREGLAIKGGIKVFLKSENYENRDGNYYHKGTNILANDYATSDLRAYINGDLITDYQLSTDETYLKIKNRNGRTLSDMYKDMGVNGDSSNYEPRLEGVAYPENGISSTDKDFLWAMSFNEAWYLIPENHKINTASFGLYAPGVDYWLRSPGASSGSAFTNLILFSGYGSFVSRNVDYTTTNQNALVAFHCAL